jgi:dihydroorotate dehydrogenase (fumarate)
LELNLYEVVTNLAMPGEAVEARLAGIVGDVRRILKIPIAVKVSPFFTAFGNMARRLDAAGADAIVLFNRFYQPDIDIRTLAPVVNVRLSDSSELRLRLRWLAVLHGRVGASLAVSGGVATPDDGIKAILAGADAVQIVSALLRHGPTHVDAMRRGLERWMDWHHFDRLDEARGRASLERVADTGTFERAQYIRTLQSWLT